MSLMCCANAQTDWIFCISELVLTTRCDRASDLVSRRPRRLAWHFHRWYPLHPLQWAASQTGGLTSFIPYDYLGVP